MNSNDVFRPFMEPNGVAIVGARRSPGFGYSIPVSLIRQGWKDHIYLVNPVGGELHGLPVHKTLTEVPDYVDLAVVIVPAPAVPGVMEEIGMRGIKNVILETAGFSETGEKGRELQDSVRDIALKYRIRIIGPNCVGVINTENKFSTVEVLEKALTKGPLSIVAQSGMFGAGIMDYIYQRNLFVSKAVTLGNRLDINECDTLEYLHKDEATRVILMYLEGASNGRRLLNILDRVTRDKPVLILKSGKTDVGRKATASHTGSLSGEDNLYDASFKQFGVVRAETVEELITMSLVFSSQPEPEGGRIGIITSSGSMGVMAADTAVTAGLEMPMPSESTVKRIREKAPGWMNVKNPLDVGPSNLFGEAIEAMLEDPAIDMVLPILIIPITVLEMFRKQGITIEKWFGDIKAIRARAPRKPLVICAMGNSQFVSEMRSFLGTDVPVITSPEPAAKALGAYWEYHRIKTGREKAIRN